MIRSVQTSYMMKLRVGMLSGCGLLCYVCTNWLAGDVQMVDFEYSGPNHLAFEIANHFCEFAGESLVPMVMTSHEQ